MSAKRDLRAMRQAAMAGDYGAARALLRLNDWKAIAAEIKTGQPWSPRVSRAVRCLVAGTGACDEPGAWEWLDPETGEILNDLQNDDRRF